MISLFILALFIYGLFTSPWWTVGIFLVLVIIEDKINSLD
jgi:hypothetical protein